MVSLFCGIMDLIQTLYVIVCFYVSKPVFSCHKHKFKNLNCQYIYPISYKIAKKANPAKRIYPYWKTISQLLKATFRFKIHSRNYNS